MLCILATATTKAECNFLIIPVIATVVFPSDRDDDDDDDECDDDTPYR